MLQRRLIYCRIPSELHLQVSPVTKAFEAPSYSLEDVSDLLNPQPRSDHRCAQNNCASMNELLSNRPRPKS